MNASFENTIFTQTVYELNIINVSQFGYDMGE